MPEQVPNEILTAVILTWNEQENIGRTLAKLTWLERIIIIDSGSTDDTIKIINSFPNTKIYQRLFDTHANQWNYGLEQCKSNWTLSLDADYILTAAFIAETQAFLLTSGVVAFNADFEFCVFGKPLRGNNTTERPVLFRKDVCVYYDDGHTQRLKINGNTGYYSSKILHDDRKPLSRWLLNQSSYSIKEAAMLYATPPSQLGFMSRMRQVKVITPFIVFFYCLFIKGLIFNGWRGWHYTLQRTMVEILVSLRLVELSKLKDAET